MMPTPTPTPSQTIGVIPKQQLPAGRYFEILFAPGGMDFCCGQAGCTETPADDTMGFAGVVSGATEPGSPAIVHSSGQLDLEWSGSEMTWQTVFR